MSEQVVGDARWACGVRGCDEEGVGFNRIEVRFSDRGVTQQRLCAEHAAHLNDTSLRRILSNGLLLELGASPL